MGIWWQQKDLPTLWQTTLAGSVYYIVLPVYIMQQSKDVQLCSISAQKLFTAHWPLASMLLVVLHLSDLSGMICADMRRSKWRLCCLLAGPRPCWFWSVHEKIVFPP